MKKKTEEKLNNFQLLLKYDTEIGKCKHIIHKKQKNNNNEY